MRWNLTLISAMTVAWLGAGCEPESMLPIEEDPAEEMAAPPAGGEPGEPPPDFDPEPEADPQPEDPWPPAAAPAGEPRDVQWLNMLDDGAVDVRVDGWRMRSRLRTTEATAVAELGDAAASVSFVRAGGGREAVIAEAPLDLSAERTLVVLAGEPGQPEVYTIALDTPDVEPIGEGLASTLRIFNASPQNMGDRWQFRDERLRVGALSAPLVVEHWTIAFLPSGQLHIPFEPGEHAVGDRADGGVFARVVRADGHREGFRADATVQVVDLMPGGLEREATFAEFSWAVPAPFLTGFEPPLLPDEDRLAITGVDSLDVDLRPGARHPVVLFDDADGPRALALPSPPPFTEGPITFWGFSTLDEPVELHTSWHVDGERIARRAPLAFGEVERLGAPTNSLYVEVELGGERFDFGYVHGAGGMTMFVTRHPDGRPLLGELRADGLLLWQVPVAAQSEVHVVTTGNDALGVHLPNGPDPFRTRRHDLTRGRSVGPTSVPAGALTIEVDASGDPLGAFGAELAHGERTTFFLRGADDLAPVAVVEPADDGARLALVNHSDGPIGLLDGDAYIEVPANAAGPLFDGGRPEIGVDRDADGVADLWLNTSASSREPVAFVYTGREADPGAWRLQSGQVSWQYATGLFGDLRIISVPRDSGDQRTVNVSLGEVRVDSLFARPSNGRVPWLYGALPTQITPAGAHAVQIDVADGPSCALDAEVQPDVAQVLVVRHDDASCSAQMVDLIGDHARVFNGTDRPIQVRGMGRGEAWQVVDEALAPDQIGAGMSRTTYHAVGVDLDDDGVLEVQGALIPAPHAGLTFALDSDDGSLLLTVMPGGHAITYTGP